MAATRSRMDEAATPASTSPERNSPALFRTSLIEPNAYVVPKRTVFSFTAAPRKKALSGGGTPGMAATRPGVVNGASRCAADGCGGLREADICGGKRPQPGWADPPEGAAPARRFPCGAGHSPPRKAAGPAPHGNGLRAYSQNSKPIGRPDGEGVPVPAATRGTGSPLVPIGGGPPSARGAAQRSVCGSRALPVSAVRAGSVLWPKEAACPAGDPRRPRGERHPARLPGKGTAATCRTASGFRPRPLP